MSTTRLMTGSEVAHELSRAGFAPSRLSADSRQIQPGDVFVAQRGLTSDGHEYIAAAIARGAAAVIAEQLPLGLSVPGYRMATAEPDELAALCRTHYQDPCARIAITGVTGTNGKTSVTQWLAQAWQQLGEPAAVIGTLGIGFAGQTLVTANTTPDLITLYRSLDSLVRQGARRLAIEVSSHALDQRRVAGFRFAHTVFTNLTPDHLDYHGSMQAYGEAKARLFTDYPSDRCIINAEDTWGQQLLGRKLRGEPLSYGLAAGDLQAGDLELGSAGVNFSLAWQGRQARVRARAVGRFNVANLLAVAGVLLAEGRKLDEVAEVLGQLEPVRGRMQSIDIPGLILSEHPHVIVDYAHTPDALAQALATLAEGRSGRLIVVFGCGGNRDRSKRPQMGRIAVEKADRVILTSDNPRFEEPAAIIADILTGIEPSRRDKVEVCVDRAEAIARALRSAQAEDTVLIAGKGHETYQETAGERRHFDDAEQVRAVLLAEYTQGGEADAG